MARPKMKWLRLGQLHLPQPAIRVGRKRLRVLADSIEEVGILVPLVVRAIGGEEYVVIGGVGRMTALRLNGAGPETMVPCLVVEVDDAEALLLALVDNVVREEMRPFDEAETARTLIEDYGYTQAAVASALGATQGSISQKLAIFRLDAKVVAAVRKNEVALQVALALLPLDHDRAAQRNLLKRIIADDLTAAQAKALVAQHRFGDRAVATMSFEVEGAGRVKARTTTQGKILVTVEANDRKSLAKLLRAAEKKVS